MDWFNANYNSSPLTKGWNNDEYYVYAMAKALTGILGTQGKVGINDWIQDLKNAMWGFIEGGQPPVPNLAPAPCYWTENEWTRSPNLGTAWVLMALAFADPATDSPQKFLPEKTASDVPVINQGLVTLETKAGVTIKNPGRINIGQANKATNVTLPIGGFDFTLLNVPLGGTAVLTITPPAGSFDRANPNGFLKPDGTLKDDFRWFKIQGGSWKGLASVPIRLVPVGGPYTAIEVTLRDGGPEDEDGVANGQIKDPGAPGFGPAGAALPAASGDGASGCFIATAAYGSNMANDVLILQRFRDNYLLSNLPGRLLVKIYYGISPPIAAYIARNEYLRTATRIALAPVVMMVKYPGALLIIIGALIGFAILRKRSRFA